jgi:hypothetical protein
MSVKLWGIKEDGRRDLCGMAPGSVKLLKFAVALNEMLDPYPEAIVEDTAVYAEREHLPPIWVVYDHPADWPGWYVACEWLGETKTGNMLLFREIEPLRDELELRGLVPMMRAESDAAVIMETWL